MPPYGVRSRLDGTISVDEDGYASPFQFFTMEAYLGELECYNQYLAKDWLGEDLGDYERIRFSQPYVTFTMQLNGLDCERICQLGMMHAQESVAPDIPNDTLVADNDVLCE